MFLDSVQSGEINVTVGGEECEARITGVQDPNFVSGTLFLHIIVFLLFFSPQYTCFVPVDPPNGIKNAEVIVNSNLFCYYIYVMIAYL